MTAPAPGTATRPWEEPEALVDALLESVEADTENECDEWSLSTLVAGEAIISALSAQRQATEEATARVEQLTGALRRALTLLDNATGPTSHGPWCNGVHELGLCEGEVHAAEMIEEIAKALGVPTSTADGGAK